MDRIDILVLLDLIGEDLLQQKILIFACTVLSVLVFHA